LRQVGVGVLGLVLLVFFGVVSVGGAAAAITSGVTLRAAKYATKTFVPVVGGIFADAAELMLASGFLLKSGIGIFGLLTVLLMVALPVLKMMALWAIYRLAAALAQPVGGETISHVLGGVAGAVAILSLSVAAVGLACFLAVAVTVAAASAVFAMH
jgi:stage III sporulation protein AE